MSSEFVSLLIPRTIDTRYLLINAGGNGLWLPTCERDGDESLRVVAAKLGEEVNISGAHFFHSVGILLRS